MLIRITGISNWPGLEDIFFNKDIDFTVNIDNIKTVFQNKFNKIISSDI